MRTYRFYFYNNRVICGRYDFEADDDDRAGEIAEILFDACSDRCASWEIWDGQVLLMSGPQKVRVQVRASNMAERRQQNIVRHEEAIRDSEWAIASSERLLVELDKLKASGKGAPRYDPPPGGIAPR
jgi:hypothetical protein